MNPGALKVAHTPTTIDVGDMEMRGQRYILVSVSTIVGVSVYFMTPKEARDLGEYLTKIAASDVIITTDRRPE